MSYESSSEEPPENLPAVAGTPGHQLSEAARTAFEAGIADSTKYAYRRALRWFTDWCAEHGLTALPATAEVLTEYATWAAYEKGKSPATIEQVRWAVVKWHELAGLPKPSTVGFSGVLKGYRAHLAQTHNPKAEPARATAADRDSITAMLATLDRTTLAGKRDAAIILVGFGIAGRRGEIASLNIESLAFDSQGMQISVYRKKTRKMEDPVLHHRPDENRCPVCAAQALIAALGRTSGPLFVRVNKHGQAAHPVIRDGVPIGDPSGRIIGQVVANVIRRCVLKAGLTGKWSGHSLRRGAATQMHRAGIDRRLIERQGGWIAGSTAVSGYIDDADRWLNDVMEGVL